MNRSLPKFGLVAMLVAVPAIASAQALLTVDGTEFVLTTAADRSLRSVDLVGATLNIAVGGNQIAVVIRSVEEDPYATGGRVFLHQFVVTDASGNQANMCAPDAAGRSLGFPVPDGRGGFDLTCTSGAEGKCIRWGYRPWEEKPGGPPMRALHQACIHMTRADYGGDGHSSTREGIMVYVCDRFGIRPCAKDAPLAFEAAWGPGGAICVARPRVPENVSLIELADRYPRLKSRLGPIACDESTLGRDPTALLINRSTK